MSGNLCYQLYWPNWWKLWPSVVTHPADEYGPACRVYSFGPLQAERYVWA